MIGEPVWLLHTLEIFIVGFLIRNNKFKRSIKIRAAIDHILRRFKLDLDLSLVSMFLCPAP